MSQINQKTSNGIEVRIWARIKLVDTQRSGQANLFPISQERNVGCLKKREKLSIKENQAMSTVESINKKRLNNPTPEEIMNHNTKSLMVGAHRKPDVNMKGKLSNGTIPDLTKVLAVKAVRRVEVAVDDLRLRIQRNLFRYPCYLN